VRAVLDLRTRYGSGTTPLNDPSKYFDLKYYNEGCDAELLSRA
jgi:hypothetical protein